MNINYYGKIQLDREAHELRNSVKKTLLTTDAHLLTFDPWVIAVSEGNVKLQLKWYCGSLEGTTFVTL